MEISKIDFKMLVDLIEQSNSLNRAKDKTEYNIIIKKVRTFISPDFLLNLELWLAAQDLVKNSTDKYDAELTISAIKSDNLKQALKFIYLAPRSMLYSKMKTGKEKFCVLVPLFLAAHKKYNNVKYEEWDKESKYFKFLVGESLWDSITPWIGHDFSDLDIKEMRAQHVKSLEDWSGYSVYYNDISWTASAWIRHIVLQTWMAHATKRNKYMILDINNWDNIPDALDEVLTSTVGNKQNKKDKSEDIPF